MPGPGSLKMKRLLREFDGFEVGDINKYGRIRMLHFFESGTRITTFEVGVTVPVDGTAGYAPGCWFLDVNAVGANALYTNIGTKLACDFDLIPTAGISHTEGVLATVTGIDGKVVAVTPLYTATTETHVLAIIVRVETVVLCTVNPTLGAGVAAGETDIIAARQLVGAAAADVTRKWDLWSGEASRNLTVGQTISLGIDVGATATTLTLSVDVLGYTL